MRLKDLPEWMPIFQAALEGKTIQFKGLEGRMIDVNPDSQWDFEVIERYLIKPEQLVCYINHYEGDFVFVTYSNREECIQQASDGAIRKGVRMIEDPNQD